MFQRIVAEIETSRLQGVREADVHDIPFPSAAVVRLDTRQCGGCTFAHQRRRFSASLFSAGEFVRRFSRLAWARAGSTVLM